MIPAGLTLLAFGALAGVLRRPFLAGGLLVLAFGVLHLVDAAKRRAVREPLVFSDLDLFSQALRFPRLYLPYFGFVRGVGVAVGFTVIVVAGLTLEPPAGGWRWLSVALFGAALLTLGSRVAPPVSFDPQEDFARFGLLATLWLYWREERKPAPAVASNSFIVRSEDLSGRPHIIALQSESFFDVRRLGVQAALEEFDRLCAAGLSGRLAVPAWGANTMRTEFAFLSGIPNAALGVHRFNPYRRFARRRIPTLATLLGERGYRTLCVHPYPAAFFGRDRVFPNLGFDEFVDLDDFVDARRDGPYVGDIELSRKVVEVLTAAAQPVFVFAISMESHGPFRLEGSDELGIYLRHLTNADAALGMLSGALRVRGDGVLCVFGDHVPSLPSLYRDLEQPGDWRTDYLVWRAGQAKPQRCDLAVEQLGQRVLNQIGL